MQNLLVQNGNFTTSLGQIFLGAGTNVTVNNATVQNSNSTSVLAGMIFMRDASNAIIANSTVKNFSGHGIIFFTFGGNNRVINATVLMNTSGSFTDFYNYGGTNNTIIDSTFNKSKIGFGVPEKQYNVSVAYTVRVNASNATDGSGIASTVIVRDNTGLNILNSSTVAATGLSPYFIVPEFYVFGLSNYTQGCVNQPNLTCLAPYNFTAQFSPFESNSTRLNVSGAALTVNISIAYCTPPSSGTWSLNKLCIVYLKSYSLPGRNLECNASCDLRIINSNLSVANTTFKGNRTLQNATFIRGAR